MVTFEKQMSFFLIGHLIIYSIGGNKFVRSIELYKATGQHRAHYTRWLIASLNIGSPGVDYFPTPENVQGRTLRYRLRFFLSIDFAEGLCMLAKTRASLETRRFLIEHTVEPVKIDYVPVSVAMKPFKDTKFSIQVAMLDMDDKEVARYGSIKEAEKASGIPAASIRKACGGLLKTSGGYKWEYV